MEVFCFYRRTRKYLYVVEGLFHQNSMCSISPYSACRDLQTFTVARKNNGKGLAASFQIFYRKIYGHFLQYTVRKTKHIQAYLAPLGLEPYIAIAISASFFFSTSRNPRLNRIIGKFFQEREFSGENIQNDMSSFRTNLHSTVGRHMIRRTYPVLFLRRGKKDNF